MADSTLTNSIKSAIESGSTNATNAVQAATKQDLDILAQGVPLALAGICIVFSALSIIAIAIFLLPKVLKALAPYLPPEAEVKAAQSTPPAATGDESQRVAAAITAALHLHRSQG